MKKFILFFTIASAAAFAGTATKFPDGIISKSSIAINTSGSLADSKALLDVSSTTQGVLISRMSTTQRDAISSPTTGLMIYNTTTNSFNLYDGTAWRQLASLLGTETFQNKTISASNNTITGLTNTNLSGSAAITNANLATMSTGTLKGNNSGSSATPSDLSATTVTSMLDAFTGDSGSGGVKGLVPAPVAGDASKFLKGDGTWASSPAGFSNPMTTGGDLIYGGASGTATRLANGSVGQVLMSAGGTSAPSWQTVGGYLVATASPSGASSTTISGLDGNTHKIYKVIMRGSWSGADAIVMGMRPNNDSTSAHYYGVRYFHYSGPTVGAISSTSQWDILRKGFTAANDFYMEIMIDAQTGKKRQMFAHAGWSVSQPDGGYQFAGGGWTDTSNNITSLVFNYGSGGTFTGTINVYTGVP